ncbi:hypothetical protein ACHAWF_016046 [Thalassiosira exigua]
MAPLAMDTSIRRIVITEDEDLNLDKLLIGDNSGAKLAPPPSPSRFPSPQSPPSSPTPAPSRPLSPPPPDRRSPSTPTSPILAREEDGDDVDRRENWTLPTPSQRGDYLRGDSLRKVPSKSILKKNSSYGTFGPSSSGSCLVNDDSSSSRRSLSRSKSQVRIAANPSPLDASLSHGEPKRRVKQSSWMSFDSSSSSAVGWDLDDNYRSRSSAGDLSSSEGAKGRDYRRSRVAFDSVEMREYDRTVGDNPCCRSGPPLSLDWSYSKKYEKNIEEFELERAVDHRLKRVNKYRRRNMLAFAWGLSDEELKEARRDTKRAQRQRSVTRALLPLHMAGQVAETAMVGLKKMVKQSKDEGKDEGSNRSGMSSTKDSSHTPAFDLVEDRLLSSTRTI